MSVPSLRGNGTITVKQVRQNAALSPVSQPAPNAENGTNRFRPRRLTNEERRILVRRLKGSQSGEHPLTEQDKRFLWPLRKPMLRPSDRVFGMEPAAFRRMLYRLKLPPELVALRIHPHMLRHACGFDLVGRADLQARAAFMGHKRLENTVRYSRLAPEQFEGLRP